MIFVKAHIAAPPTPEILVTHLTSVPKFRCHGPCHGLIHVGTVENDEWGQAAQLHGDPLHSAGCVA